MNALYIISTYVFIDDTLKVMGHRDHHHCAVSGAEILTVAIIASKYFQNHHERALCILQLTGYIPRLSISRFNRRLHQAGDRLVELLDYWSSQRITSQNWHYVVDTMPLPVCRVFRVEQCRKIPQVKGYIGRCSAKRTWFSGWRLHWLCDPQGFPISYDIVPAVWHELSTVQTLMAPLPPGSQVFADGAYINFEDQMIALTDRIRLVAKTHSRITFQNTPLERALIKRYRARIESQHSVLEKMGVQRLHAVTQAGFGIKVYASLVALAITILMD